MWVLHRQVPVCSSYQAEGEEAGEEFHFQVLAYRSFRVGAAEVGEPSQPAEACDDHLQVPVRGQVQRPGSLCRLA